MMNQFFLERELLIKIEDLERLCRSNKFKISEKIKQKSENLKIKIPEELRSRMCQNTATDIEKCFNCKFCGKGFKDGRQLGGHISRAHKSLNIQDHNQANSDNENLGMKKENLSHQDALSQQQDEVQYFIGSKLRKIKRQARKTDKSKTLASNQRFTRKVLKKGNQFFQMSPSCQIYYEGSKQQQQSKLKTQHQIKSQMHDQSQVKMEYRIQNEEYSESRDPNVMVSQTSNRKKYNSKLK